MRKNKRQPEITGRWFYPVQHFDYVVNHSIDEVVERLRQRHQEPRGCLDLRYLIKVHVTNPHPKTGASFIMHSRDTSGLYYPPHRPFTIQGAIEPIDKWTCRVYGQAQLGLFTNLMLLISVIVPLVAAILHVTGSQVSSDTMFIVLLSGFPFYYAIHWDVRNRQHLMKELAKALYEPRKAKSKNAHQNHSAA